MTGVDEVNSELWFERADSRRTTRNNLVPKRSHHEYRRNFFSQRVVETWNLLPAEVREAATMSQFKRLYRRHTQAAEHPHRGPRWIIEDHLPSEYTWRRRVGDDRKPQQKETTKDHGSAGSVHWLYFYNTYSIPM